MSDILAAILNGTYGQPQPSELFDNIRIEDD